MPGIKARLDQKPRGRRQQDQPADHADQLAQQATGLLKKDRDGADVTARLGKPTLERRGTGG
jgi:hypothetical protein